MDGLNHLTGQRISGLEHLYQSIQDILTTPIGTRVMLREYGSDIPRLLDSPMNRQTFGYIYNAAARALNKWEPRLKLTRVQVMSVSASGVLSLAVEGKYLGQTVSLTTEVVRL